MRTIRPAFIIHHSSFILCLLLAFPALAQNNAKEIMARPQGELIAILKSPKATEFDKAKACQRLAEIGTKEAVPALAALLPDEHLNCYARGALEVIPGREAAAALREAATKLKGLQLVGVLNSIGRRKDAEAVKLLGTMLDDTNATVASSAAGALGQIDTIDAARALVVGLAARLQGEAGSNSTALAAAADGLLVRVVREAAPGHKGDVEGAEQCCAALAGINPDWAIDLPNRLKLAAMRELFPLEIRLGHAIDVPEETVKALLAEIQSPGKEPFNVGLELAREVPGKQLTTALARELEKLPADRRALLLRALADRADGPALATMMAAAKSDSPAVREAAIYALARHGGAAALPILLDAAAGKDKIAEAARRGLTKTLKGKAVDAAIVARLDGADAKTKVVLLGLIGARQITAAEPAVRQALGKADPAVRLAAIGTLGQIISPRDVEFLADLAMKAPSPETSAARAALRLAVRRAGERDNCEEKLAAKFAGASVADRAYLLALLGEVSSKKALEAVAAAVKSADPAIKDAATKALGEWGNADAAPVLLEIAKTDPSSKYRTRAVRGFLRIARQFQVPAEERLEMFRAAMELAPRDDERNLALDILTRIPSPAALELAVSYARRPALRGMATAVAIEVSDTQAPVHPQQVAASLRKLLEIDRGEKSAAQIKDMIAEIETGG